MRQKQTQKAFGYDGGVTKAPKIVDIHSERDCGVNRYQLPRLLNRSVPPSRRPPSTPTCACRYIYTFYNLLLSYTATLRFIVVVVYRLCSPTPLSFGAFDCETPTDLRRKSWCRLCTVVQVSSTSAGCHVSSNINVTEGSSESRRDGKTYYKTKQGGGELELRRRGLTSRLL